MRRTKLHILAALLVAALLLSAFAAPAGDVGIGIQITPPTGWTNRDANVTITITDYAGNGFSRAMVKGEGDWRDITAELEQQSSQYDMALTVSGNCTVTVSVTGWDGQTYEASQQVNCFDRDAPTLRTSFTAQQLHVEAADTASGVAAVYVDGQKYTALDNGAVDVPLAEIGAGNAKINVQAEDSAGNLSQAVAVENPSYKTAASEPDTPPVQTTPPVTTKPATTTQAATTVPTKPPTGGGSTTTTTPVEPTAPKEPEEKEDPGSGTALTPEGNLSLSDDIHSATSDEKQFVTVTTKNGNYFYLIIDRAEDGENSVHFLNQVDEADLLALMEDGGTGAATPAVCSCTDKCKAGAVNTACELCAVDMTECVGREPPPEPDPDPDVTPEPDPDPDPKPEKGGKNGLLVVVLAVALAGGGAAYFLKFKKNKPDTKGSADLDDYDYGDEDDEDEKEDEDA
jgi:hypothetical protein